MLFQTKGRVAFDTAQVANENADGWVECCESGKFGYLRAEDVELLEGPCLNELYRCIDVFLSCNDASDDASRLLKSIDGSPQRVIVSSELPRESYQTKVLSLNFIE